MINRLRVIRYIHDGTSVVASFKFGDQPEKIAAFEVKTQKDLNPGDILQIEDDYSQQQRYLEVVDKPEVPDYEIQFPNSFWTKPIDKEEVEALVRPNNRPTISLEELLRSI